MRSTNLWLRVCPAVGALAGLCACCLPALAECTLTPGPTRTVTRVIDGETLALDDGSEVRLAGALAPRGFDARTDEASWPAAVAAKAALAALAEGHSVVLGYAGSAKTDRQNRHVAQVFVVEDGQETWLQGRMLSEGHARAYQQKDHRGCAEELLAFEKTARDAVRGVWTSGAYQIRPASRPRDLEGMAGNFVVLTGKVAWVVEGRQTIALGFTPARSGSWGARRGIIVMIENGDHDLRGTFGGDAKALEGKAVEVRGWLEQRLGRPAGTSVLDISLAGMIVVIGNSAQTVATANKGAPAAATAPP